MAIINIRTKDKSNNVKGKPRVYFTCHPDDFEKHFDKICEDIFKTHDCAVFYTENMTESIAEEDKETDLGQNNLFVVPVTFKLLTKPNRAMDEDIAYAKEKKIPILPFMMETGIDEFYSKPDKFGERQYLLPYSTDTTEMRYEDKLKKYLESVLISAETAERVRKAFDAYIFLSYRKKDRKYANELMKLIHKNPKYRNIAIWYDEFLTPGESFQKNIEKAMKNSKLFALLVTPNLLEEPDGKPNFVMSKEYPMAQKEEMSILPAEMEPTDHLELINKYPNVPECVDPREEELLNENLAKTLVNIAIRENDADPEHNFLIGLAYLDGIDVEVDRGRGIELISSAAEAELPEAMKKLIEIYDSEFNYREKLKWCERLYEHYKRECGEEHPDALLSLSNFAYTYGELGDHKKALELHEKIYALHCRILGEEHPDTLISLNNLAGTYGELGDHKKALELHKKIYALHCRILSEEHPDALLSLGNLASMHYELGNHKKALELYEKVYALRCKILGEEHPSTLTSLNNLASMHYELGDHKKALELFEKVYALQCRMLGEEHPDTLKLLNNLVLTYGELGDHKKALALGGKVYALQCGMLGEEHPKTLLSLNNLALTYGKLGDHEKALELFEKVHALQCMVLGEEHPSTLTSLNNLALTYGELGNYKKALELYEKVYALRCKILGEEHPYTLLSLSNFAYTYGELGDYKKSIELGERVYALQYKILGEEHPDTLTSLNYLAYMCAMYGDFETALKLYNMNYPLCYKVYGAEHPTVISVNENILYLEKILSES